MAGLEKELHLNRKKPSFKRLGEEQQHWLIVSFIFE